MNTREYLTAEVSELQAAINRRDGHAAELVIRRMMTNGYKEFADLLSREIIAEGIQRLAERAGAGDARAMEDLTDALLLLVG